jgi:uncharacterized protein (TIGR03435 family)
MLAERFKLKTHFETKEGTVYALAVGKDGPKMKPSPTDMPPRLVTSFGNGHISSGWMPMRAMAALLTQELGHPVIDKTGLTGDYVVTLDWAPTEGAVGRDSEQAGTPGDVAKPSLFTAVEEQLGLKLGAQKGPIETLAIDAAEKPSVDGAELQAPPAEFAVSTVKLDKSESNFSSGIDTEHGMLRAENVTLKRCIMGSYGVGPEQVVGGPDWADTLRFDIVAKADQPVQDDAVMNVMLQRLLADRFKLGLHRETRTLEAYVLEVDKKGAKLAAAKGGDSSTNTETNQAGVTITARNTGMGLLAEDLARVVDLPVLDQTGLKGIYDFTLHWTPDNLRVANNADSISVFAAIAEQLGLRLRATKAPVEVLVIDHAEMPSEN